MGNKATNIKTHGKTPSLPVSQAHFILSLLSYQLLTTTGHTQSLQRGKEWGKGGTLQSVHSSFSMILLLSQSFPLLWHRSSEVAGSICSAMERFLFLLLFLLRGSQLELAVSSTVAFSHKATPAAPRCQHLDICTHCGTQTLRNHRITWKGPLEVIWGHLPLPSSCQKDQFCRSIRLLPALPKQIFDVSKGNYSASSLGNLPHYLSIIAVKNFSLYLLKISPKSSPVLFSL